MADSGYGDLPFGEGIYGGAPADNPRHFYALKKAYPINNIGGIFDDDMTIKGRHLDNAEDSATSLLKELSPSTALLSLSHWENVYGVPGQGAPAILAKMRRMVNKAGRLSKTYYVNVIAGLSYTITITEGTVNYFYAGASSLPHSFYSAGSGAGLFTWIVNNSSGLNTEQQNQIKNNLETIKPAWTQILYNFT